MRAAVLGQLADIEAAGPTRRVRIAVPQSASAGDPLGLAGLFTGDGEPWLPLPGGCPVSAEGPGLVESGPLTRAVMGRLLR
ncbi:MULTISPECIES: hypothetical protein [Streptomyces]|uniref:hypothetical protein n=1 Tax=Streptomyces TaxID=1883 RepID=UPI001300FD8E|nr:MULTISPECIES: hypothetical protein [Streptomyces]MBX9426919.1 hypothetical protein [Streptomyces lateritius]